MLLVLFVVLGALLVLRWPKVMWVHLPMLAWGVYIEFSGNICPLTPLENALRERGGQAGYEGGFIEHYIVAALCPEGLTREIRVWLGIAAMLPNLLAYGWILMKRWRDAR